MAHWVALASALKPIVSGCSLAIGGMTLYRRPVAAALAIARSKVRDLEVVTFTAGLETDLLVGAGCVRRLRSCYAGLEIVGLAPHFTAAARQGTLEVIEETEYTLTYAVLAGTMRVPFLPMLDTLSGTDLYRNRPDLHRFDCPVSGKPLMAVPAVRVDVALLHAAAADEEGNCWLSGQLALDPYLPTVARTTVVTVERRVTKEELLSYQGGLRLPAHSVDALALVPGGSLPTSCYPHQALDLDGMLDYVDAAEDPQAWPLWLESSMENVAEPC